MLTDFDMPGYDSHTTEEEYEDITTTIKDGSTTDDNIIDEDPIVLKQMYEECEQDEECAYPMLCGLENIWPYNHDYYPYKFCTMPCQSTSVRKQVEYDACLILFCAPTLACYSERFVAYARECEEGVCHIDTLCNYNELTQRWDRAYGYCVPPDYDNYM